MWDKGLHLILILLLFIYLFGFIWGIPYLIFSVFLFDTIAPMFGYQRITDFNLAVLYLSEEYNSNISLYMQIDKIDFESFERTVYQRTISAILRMRQVPVRYFGLYLWKEVDIDIARQQVKKEDKHFDDHASFLEYFQQISNQKMDMTKPLFEFRLIEDYTEDTSMIIFICDHTFCDGVSCASLLSTLNDDQFSIPNKKAQHKFSIVEKLILAAKTFFTFSEIEKKAKTYKTDKNTKGLLKQVRNDNIRTGYYESDIEIPFEVVRKYYKTYDGMTFNDFMLALIGKSLHEHCNKKGISNPQSLRFELPVNHKRLPTGYHDVNICDYLTIVDLELPIVDSIKQGYKTFKPWLSHILKPDTQKQLINFMHMIPYVPKSYMMSEIKASSEGSD